MEVEFSQTGRHFAANQLKVEQVNNNASTGSGEQSIQKQDVGQVAETSKVNVVAADTDIGENEVERLSVEAAVDDISRFVQAQNRQLAFSIDDKTDRAVVKVTDSETGKTIRQIPSEEALKLSERIKDLQSEVGAAVGVLFSKQV